jgi:hypothetical protein
VEAVVEALDVRKRRTKKSRRTWQTLAKVVLGRAGCPLRFGYLDWLRDGGAKERLRFLLSALSVATSRRVAPLHYCEGIRVSQKASCTRRSRRKQTSKMGARERFQGSIGSAKGVVCACGTLSNSRGNDAIAPTQVCGSCSNNTISVS